MFLANLFQSILNAMGLGKRIGDNVHLEHIDGKGTVEYTIKEDCKLLMGSAQLEEVPDSGASTLTVVVTDGTNNVSDTLSFAQGTDTAGTVKNFNMVQTYWRLKAGATLRITTAGTTVTAGEMIVKLLFKRM